MRRILAIAGAWLAAALVVGYTVDLLLEPGASVLGALLSGFAFAVLLMMIYTVLLGSRS